MREIYSKNNNAKKSVLHALHNGTRKPIASEELDYEGFADASRKKVKIEQLWQSKIDDEY